MTSTVSEMGRPPKKEKTEPLRLPESMVKRIRRLAAHRKQDAGDYVAERFSAILDEEEKKMLKDIEKEQKQSKEDK